MFRHYLFVSLKSNLQKNNYFMYNQDVYFLEKCGKFLKDFLYLKKSENFHEILLRFEEFLSVHIFNILIKY